MFAIEFQAQIKDGTIELPEAYRERMSGTVRVIILSQETSTQPDFIDHLMAHPLRIEQFTPIARDLINE